MPTESDKVYGLAAIGFVVFVVRVVRGFARRWPDRTFRFFGWLFLLSGLLLSVYAFDQRANELEVQFSLVLGWAPLLLLFSGRPVFRWFRRRREKVLPTTLVP